MLPDIACACATVRRLSRLLTQLYDDHLRSSGVEAPQMVLLGTLAALPGISQVALGARLALDKTTLSRNLRLMEANGWIEPAPAKDRRKKGFRLTLQGQDRLAAAKPMWAAAQARFESSMSPEEWQGMFTVLKRATDSARRAQIQGDR